MNGCTLEIAGTAVTRSEGGALEAEYTMFDASEIELRATEYGAIREVGYRTTVADALARLDAAGATTAAIRDIAAAMQGAARHYVAERAVALLGIVTPSELLTADTFDPERRLYSSPLLDIGRLAVDTGVTGAAAVIQAVGLAAWLRDARPDDEVQLRTIDYMAPRLPGERSIRRVTLAGLRALTPALHRIRDRAPPTGPDSPRADVAPKVLLEWLRRRGASEERVSWAELALVSDRGSVKGPLSDPRALAIHVLFEAGRGRDAIPLVDRLEIEVGRTPSVQYLRLRGSLESEPPQGVAERATALLVREPSPELRLLAARAWSDAGNAARAVSLASEVLGDPQSPPSLRDNARRYVDVTGIIEGEPRPRSPSGTPTVNAPAPAMPGAPSFMRPSAPSLTLDLPPRSTSPTVTEVTGFDVPMSMRPTPVPPRNPDEDPQSKRPFIMGLSSPPQGLHASKAPTPPGPRVVDTTTVNITAALAGQRDSNAEISFRSLTSTPPSQAAVTAPPPEVGGSPSTWARGASQPPFQSMRLAALPLPLGGPVYEARPPEVAESLSLPPGLHGQAVPFDAVPKSVAEARVQFTLLSRALGRAYRERRGVTLKTDLTGVEHAQMVLRERFVVPAIRNAEEASEVRSHGAFLSEILARTFGAEWVDIAPSELGYWAMATPTGLRIFPFGRVLRFILQGHRERDLVSYYLELESRLNRRR